MSERIIDAQRQSPADDIRFTQGNQRRVDAITTDLLDSGPGRQIGQRFEGGDVFGTAIA